MPKFPHDRLSERVTELSTELLAPARVTLFYEAPSPPAPIEVLPYKILAISTLVSLCLPFGLAVFWERLIQRVSDTDQLEQRANLAVVGEVARLPVRRNLARGLPSQRVGRGIMVFEESIDGLRTYLMLSEPLKDMKVLAVTSACKGEGKTSLVSQLAVSMARTSGEPVLLIDGDMRCPDIHDVFGVPLSPGLASVLRHECTVGDAIVTDASENVHVLPAGKLRGSPHELLGNGVFRSLLDELRPVYHHIIIDTPPVLAASEALVLAKAADQSLMCGMRDASRIDQVRRAHARLVSAGVEPFGIVLNGVSASYYSRRYGTYAYASD